MPEEMTKAGLQRPLSEVKAGLFRALAHPARVRALEVLSEGPRTVGELQQEIGIESSHLSQQLAVLRRANLVQTRKEGASVLYTVADPRIFELLEVARAILTTSLSGTQGLLEDLASLDFTVPAAPRSGTASQRPPRPR
jgi:DNA-binding transcriptional ArsR family regulator